MYFLGHEDRLRSLLGFPPNASLWGKDGCRWQTHSKATQALDALLRSPDSTANHAARAELIGKERLIGVDELLIHSRFRHAHDLASLLAATPAAVSDAKRTRASWIAHVDTRVVAFLRLKAVLAAIEGGLYQRARADLFELNALQRTLRDDDECCRLLNANIALLWGRLLQLFFLVQASTTKLEEAERLFNQTASGIPCGFSLIRRRASIHGVEHRSVDEFTKQIVDDETREKGLHIFGEIAEHYRYYLSGRAAVQGDRWSDALAHFKRAERLLEKHRHGTLVDQVRLGYVRLGRGEALVGRGQRGDKADAELGLRLLLEARWIFRDHEFTPGEYIASRLYSHAVSKHPKFGSSTLPLLKEVMRLSLKSNVPAFRLIASVEYADMLYAIGRPNAAQGVLKEVSMLEHDPLAAELLKTRAWHQSRQLAERTTDAKANGVEPLCQWGISRYAEAERDFVAGVKSSSCVVSAFGQPGSARRTFLARVSEARGQQGNAWMVMPGERSHEAVVREILHHTKADGWVILSNMDQWHRDLQHQIALLLLKKPELAVRIYATLSVPLVDIRDAAPKLQDLLSQGAWNISPLSDRPEDTLLLARGFLIRALMNRKRTEKGGPLPGTMKNIIFTGAACNYILQRFNRIRELLVAMRHLGSRIDMALDVIAVPDGRLKVPEEAIHRHLVSLRAPDTSPSRDGLPDVSSLVAEDVKKADAALVHQLAQRFPSKAAVARAARINRTTLHEAWKASGVDDEWRKAKSASSRSRTPR